MKKIVDLSHQLEQGIITFKGLPAPRITDFLSREASKSHYSSGTTFHIGKIEMVANTVTYIDSPFHRYSEGKDLSELPLESIADLNGVVFRMEPTQQAIERNLFADSDVRGKAVLIHTGWAKYWDTEQYFEGHPYLTEDAAEWLKKAGASIVGIDSLNIDDTTNGNRPVHSTLLKADIPIIEHMCNMENLPDSGFKFHAVPVKVCKFGSFPVRAYAIFET